MHNKSESETISMTIDTLTGATLYNMSDDTKATASLEWIASPYSASPAFTGTTTYIDEHLDYQKSIDNLQNQIIALHIDIDELKLENKQLREILNIVLKDFEK